VGDRFLKDEIQCRLYVEEEWDKLQVSDFCHYVNSMSERVQACTDSRGGHTKW
jgi:hypothetical protein